MGSSKHSTMVGNDFSNSAWSSFTVTLGVANDVDEQDMGDLKLDLFLNFGGHARSA